MAEIYDKTQNEIFPKRIKVKENTKIRTPELPLKESMITVFQCVKCEGKYFSPPTRCKSTNCSSIKFVITETLSKNRSEIISGF